MCCTVGCPGPVLAPVAGRKTVFELDITAAAAAPARDGLCTKMHEQKKWLKEYQNWHTGLWKLGIPLGKWEVNV